MRDYALAMRSALRRHPWAASVLESRTATSETRMRHHDGMIGRLRQSGFSIELAQKAYLTLDSYIYGFALQESAWPLDEPEIPDAIASMDVDPKDYPYLTEMMAYAAETASTDPSAASELLTFEFGLDLILDGLERLVGAT